MSEEKAVMEYDDDEAVRFIRKSLPQDIESDLSDDEINYVIDLIYDFYEEEGFFEEDDEDEIVIDEDEIISYVTRNARKDKIRDFTDKQIEGIVAGELAYCDSLNLFE